MSRKGAAVRAYNQQVRAYNQYRQDVVNAVNNHMRRQIDGAVTRQQEQINAAVAEAQARQEAYAMASNALNRIPGMVFEGLGRAIAGAFGIAGNYRLSHVPHVSPAATPEAPHMRTRSGSPVAAIVFEKAPRH